MSSWLDMHEIIDLPRITDDDIVPDSVPHIVYVNNPNPDSAMLAPYVPIVLTGSQWDLLWWIYRLSEESSQKPYDMFAFEYIEKVYENYLKNK